MESKTEQQCIIQATLDKFNGSTGWTSEAMDKRAMDVQRVLGVLYTMVQDVVREGLFGCNGQQSTLIHSGETVEWCKFYSFGSYRLGVNTLQSDVDVLCIGPNKVARSFFFERLSNRLAQDELCTKKLILTAAIVPVMKIVFDTVELDIVYGELNMAILPASLVLTNDDIFQYCAKDTPTMLSLNGSRVTDKLLELVPSQEVFQTSLRFVKQWAAQRGLVSNSFGFLSGVAWAILTAYVCQRFPTSSAAHIITEFFALYASWPWPRPVSLIDCTTTATKSSRPKCAWASWDAAKNPADAKDVLPVLTPVLPIMNTAQNVSLTTRRILIDEWKRAAHSISASSTSTSWMALLQPQRFLFDFTNYISVTVLARSEADLQTWFVFSLIYLFYLLCFSGFLHLQIECLPTFGNKNRHLK